MPSSTSQSNPITTQSLLLLTTVLLATTNALPTSNSASALSNNALTARDLSDTHHHPSAAGSVPDAIAVVDARNAVPIEEVARPEERRSLPGGGAVGGGSTPVAGFEDGGASLEKERKEKRGRGIPGGGALGVASAPVAVTEDGDESDDESGEESGVCTVM